MKLTPYIDPFAEMEALMRRLPMMHSKSAPFAPPMDIYDTKDAIVIETPLVGIDPKHVEIQIHDRVLTITGKTKKEHEVDDKNYYRKEIRSGSFYRQVALPTEVREDAVQATCTDGVLKITAPKQATKKHKTIKIKIADSKNHKK